ncbi:hypothetical protein VNO78_17552 [Psophocarpus tetragonolobus]|uniref:BED-type domain-containing protein n=1 Tax=Psophocarpus tetragonolobus TaxID=3891 RepID=A0AAN9SIG7_PSOTE
MYGRGTGTGSNSSDPNATAATSSTARSRSKNAAGNRSDIGWKHGNDVQGNAKKVKCNYCSKIVSGGISRFKHHLAGTREDCEPCASVPDEVKVVMMKVIAEIKETSKKKRRLVSIKKEEEDIQSEGANCKKEESINRTIATA